MIPEFTEAGLLPPGIHRATFEEFERRFAYFDRSDRRFRIFDKLRELHQQAKMSGIVRRILIGGSFVTDKPEPNDFDCILVLDPAIEGHELRPMEYNVASGKMACRIFRGDIYSYLDGIPALHKFTKFFQFTRELEPMGIVEIEL